MIINEQTFDDRLKRIGDYQCDIESRGRLFQILRELRDIAAVSLKANHEVKEN